MHIDGAFLLELSIVHVAENMVVRHRQIAQRQTAQYDVYLYIILVPIFKHSMAKVHRNQRKKKTTSLSSRFLRHRITLG